jgi:cytochrome P450
VSKPFLFPSRSLLKVYRFAGTGTTAMTMVYLLYELAKLPDFQTKLYEEILAAMTSTNGGPEYKDVINLPLLQALINETLRRHPAIVGVLPREAVVDMVIDSTAIPKGVCNGYCPFHL